MRLERGSIQKQVLSPNASFHHLIPSLFVWGIWALMLLAALAFVKTYGSNVPSWDGWDMVPTLTGQQPVSAGWLWSQHNEHRVPVPRLILLGLNRIIGINFRIGMYFNVFALGVLALAMILVVKRLRGWMSYSDAFFPLVLLHWGQATNLLWGWQVQFLSSAVLTGVVLLSIVQHDARPKLKTAVITGFCLILLPLCGANGLVLVPVLALWLVYMAVLHWNSQEPRAQRDSFLILSLVSSACLLVGLYFVGYEAVPYQPTGSVLMAILKAGVFLVMGFGPAMRHVWPFSGLGVLCLLLLSTAVLVGVGRNKPQERHRALGLLSFLGAIASLALVLGLGGRSAFETRYTTLVIPAWCCVYFVWSIYGPRRINLVARMLLLIIAGLALWPNAQFGVAYAKDLRHHLGAFERDMGAGLPSGTLIGRHWRYLHMNHDILTDYLPMLRRASVGKFRFLRENPAFREVSIPLVPTALNQVRWEGKTAHGTGRESYLVFTLPEAQYVYGIHLKYLYSDKERTPPCRYLYWKRNEDNDFPDQQHSASCPTGDHANWSRGTWVKLTESEFTTTVWVSDTIKDIKIHPDFKPFTFQILKLSFLVSAEG